MTSIQDSLPDTSSKAEVAFTEIQMPVHDMPVPTLAHSATNNSDKVSAIHSYKGVKTTGKIKSPTVSKCFKSQIKKKGKW